MLFNRQLAKFKFSFIIIIIFFILYLFKSSFVQFHPAEEKILNETYLKPKNIEFCENKNKYIRFECKQPLCGGWADRLRGLMGAYIWSIFTKREFLIDIDYPCSLSLMLNQNIVKWNNPIKCYDYFNNTRINHKEPFSSVKLKKVSNKDFYLMLREIDIFEYYKEANLITVQNNLDWIYAFSSNKRLNRSIHELGYKPSNFRLYYFFRKFYNDLFKLTPKLEKTYLKFVSEAKPDNETILICTQIRIGGVRPNVKWDSEFMPSNSSKLFWKFIRETFLDKNPEQKYKLFVSTDTEAVEKESLLEFGEDMIVKIDGPFVHIDREEVGNVNNCSRVEKVILDFHALQLCDIAIISQSGYGRLGISNRIDPAKDLYRFEVIVEKQKLNNSQFTTIRNFVFKKIESLDKL
jgi:hypothetical protein